MKRINGRYPYMGFEILRAAYSIKKNIMRFNELREIEFRPWHVYGETLNSTIPKELRIDFDSIDQAKAAIKKHKEGEKS